VAGGQERFGRGGVGREGRRDKERVAEYVSRGSVGIGSRKLDLVLDVNSRWEGRFDREERGEPNKLELGGRGRKGACVVLK
jgi:hypothetical protein